MSSKPYRLVIANHFAKDLRQLDSQVRERIFQALAKLEENPYQGEKVLAQETGTWRLRVGDWRVRYDIILFAKDLAIVGALRFVAAFGAGCAATLLTIFGRGPRTLAKLAQLDEETPETIEARLQLLEWFGFAEWADDERWQASEAGRAPVEQGRSARVTRLATGLADLSAEDRDILARAASLLDQLALTAGGAPPVWLKTAAGPDRARG